MQRYLLRLANKSKSKPGDIHQISDQIRGILGSRESASHFRIGTTAIEFNLFVRSSEELVKIETLLNESGLEILSDKLLDTPPKPVRRDEALREGVQLFNEERYWESHEVLEQIWRESKGAERDALQGLILTAAAFVHYQKNETDVFLSIIKRARAKLDHLDTATQGFYQLVKKLDAIIESGHVQVFKLRTIGL